MSNPSSNALQVSVTPELAVATGDFRQLCNVTGQDSDHMGPSCSESCHGPPATELLASDLGARGAMMGLRAAGHRGRAFNSDALRFAVEVVERLQIPSKPNGSVPTTDGCYACLEVLEDLLPLMGPLHGVYDLSFSQT